MSGIIIITLKSSLFLKLSKWFTVNHVISFILFQLMNCPLTSYYCLYLIKVTPIRDLFLQNILPDICIYRWVSKSLLLFAFMLNEMASKQDWQIFEVCGIVTKHIWNICSAQTCRWYVFIQRLEYHQLFPAQTLKFRLHLHCLWSHS